LSRNKDRTGSRSRGENIPPNVGKSLAEQGSDGGGFSFVVPTEFVDLPSMGRYYPKNHPLHMQDTVEIRQMTAKEEDILTSRTLLKKGIALDRVVSNVMVNRGIDVDSLLIGDKNAIIIALRVSGYGNEYITKTTCPQCGNTDEYNFDLNDTKIYRGEDMHTMDVVDNEDGTFNVILPKTQLDVTFRVLTGRDEKAITYGMGRKKNAPEMNVTKQLASIVVAANGNDSREAVNYVVQNIPSMDSRHLRTAYRVTAPNIDLTQYYDCNECGYEAEMEVPLSANFFWPDR